LHLFKYKKRKKDYRLKKVIINKIIIIKKNHI